jgi:hypothetical protein
MTMTPKRARKILREMNRRDRRETLRGLYLLVDPDGSSWAVREDGMVKPAPTIPLDFTSKINAQTVRDLIDEVTGNAERLGLTPV